MRSSFSVYFVTVGDVTGLTVGLAFIDGDGIAGLSDTTGTFGLTVGVTTFDLQPQSSAVRVSTSAKIAEFFFILKPPK